MQKFGKVVLWIIIGFIMLKGLVGIFRPNNTINYQKDLDVFKTSTLQQEQLKSEGAALAEIFAKEYLTYKANNLQEYSDRVSQYLPSYLQSMTNNINSSVDVEAVDAKAFSTETVSNNQINVDVKVRERYGTNGGLKDVYLKIPIVEQAGKYAVEDIPELIPKPELASPDFSYISGSTINEEDEPGIRNMLNNFLGSYCEGNPTELSYYFTGTNISVRGLEGLFKFKSLDDLKMYSWPDKNNFMAVVDFTVYDPSSKQDIKQGIHIQMIKKTNKYYIKNFDVRTGNVGTYDSGGGNK